MFTYILYNNSGIIRNPGWLANMCTYLVKSDCLVCFPAIISLSIIRFQRNAFYTCIVGPLRLNSTAFMAHAYLRIFKKVNQISLVNFECCSGALKSVMNFYCFYVIFLFVILTKNYHWSYVWSYVFSVYELHLLHLFIYFFAGGRKPGFCYYSILLYVTRCDQDIALIQNIRGWWVYWA